MYAFDSFIIVKKAKYPFSQFLAPFEENNQKLVRNEGINSILCMGTEPIEIKTGKNNLLQHYLSSRHLLDDHNILKDTKNRAETTYLNIFLSIKSGSFWVRGCIDKTINDKFDGHTLK